jgi:hypothetical protein
MPKEPVSRGRKGVTAGINLFAAATAGPMGIVARLNGPVSPLAIRDNAGLYLTVLRLGVGEGVDKELPSLRVIPVAS